MIEQERADALNLLIKQKQRDYKATFAQLYLGERLNGSNDQQELDADGTGPGSEPGGVASSEPPVVEPERDPVGNETERPGAETPIL